MSERDDYLTQVALAAQRAQRRLMGAAADHSPCPKCGACDIEFRALCEKKFCPWRTRII